MEENRQWSPEFSRKLLRWLAASKGFWIERRKLVSAKITSSKPWNSLWALVGGMVEW